MWSNTCSWVNIVNLLLITLLYCSFGQKPNILFIYVDDVGFNDFGFNQNTETQTPFIDNLVEDESLLIEQNYVSFVCSPTRAQMLSGRYASSLGLQHNVFTENAPYSLTRQVSLLSNEFQSNGYSTHLIGKYHLGYQAWEYTPTYRGFDTFSGFYNGEETYFQHMAYVKDTDMIYYDLREGEEPDLDVTTYSVYKQRDQFLRLLDDINGNDDPFFIYLAFQAAHYPPQAPIEYSSKYCNPLDNTQDIDTDTDDDNDDDINKRMKPPYHSDDDVGNDDIYIDGNCTAHHLHMAQMTSIDDAMEVIINKMKDMDIWDTTLVVFSSDNGAAMFSGDNAPLRGCKTTPFEGGVRTPAFVTGGYLNEERRGEILNEFPVHATDWYSTLLSAANLEINYKRSKRLYASNNINDDDDDDVVDTKWDYIDAYNIEIPLDGKNIWDTIQNGQVNDDLIDREILLHLDEIDCPYPSCGALRYKNWKFIRGPYICDDTVKCGWNNAFMTDPDNNILGCPMITDDEILTNLIKRSKDDKEGDSMDWITMSCSDGCLFNLQTDPCEYYDVKADYPEILELMENKLLYWQTRSVIPLMGANETYLNDDEIRPTIVCNSEYWCPYMKYDDVEFEQVLYLEYTRLYGEDVINLRANTWPLYVIGLFTFMGAMSVLYIKLWKTDDNVKRIIYEEAAPLL